MHLPHSIPQFALPQIFFFSPYHESQARRSGRREGKGERRYVLLWNCYVRFSEILLPSTLDGASSSGGDDPSAKIWNLSLARTSEHDAAMIDRWKGDMDGILIYVCFRTVYRRLELHLPFGTMLSRQVYSPRRSLHFSSKATSTSSPIPLRGPPTFGTEVLSFM